MQTSRASTTSQLSFNSLYWEASRLYSGTSFIRSLKLTVSTCTTGIPFGPCAPHATHAALADRALAGSGFERPNTRSLKWPLFGNEGRLALRVCRFGVDKIGAQNLCLRGRWALGICCLGANRNSELTLRPPDEAVAKAQFYCLRGP